MIQAAKCLDLGFHPFERLHRTIQLQFSAPARRPPMFLIHTVGKVAVGCSQWAPLAVVAKAVPLLAAVAATPFGSSD